MIENQLAKIHGATLRADRPQHIGQILHAELVGGLQTGHPEFHFHTSIAALHLRLTIGGRHELRALHVDLRRRGIAIVDRLHLVRDRSFAGGCRSNV